MAIDVSVLSESCVDSKDCSERSLWRRASTTTNERDRTSSIAARLALSSNVVLTVYDLENDTAADRKSESKMRKPPSDRVIVLLSLIIHRYQSQANKRKAFDLVQDLRAFTNLIISFSSPSRRFGCLKTEVFDRR